VSKLNLPFLKEERVDLRDQITFTGNRLDFYIPSYFLDPNEEFAVIMGNRVESIGLLWFEVDKKFYELQIPVKIQFEFTETYKKKARLKPGMPEIEYDVFTLSKGDAFLHDLNYKQNIDDLAVTFISKLIEGGKLPQTISYDEVFPIYLKALEVTNITKLGISAVTLEFMLSELYRNRRNNSEPFRLNYDGKRISPYDYKMLRITKVPEMNSTFTGLLGEDINQQIISAVLKNREGKKERISPIEKIIKY